MSYEAILVNDVQNGIEITLNRVEQRNTLNRQLLIDLHAIFDKVENDSSIKYLILKGQQGLFCTGMDFNEMVASMGKAIDHNFSEVYMHLLKRMTAIPKVVFSQVEGQVLAGGIGLVAASDVVVATPDSKFSLSEALWGLLPANVMPFLIRRTGFQPAYLMTLTTQMFNGTDAFRYHLVDEVSENVAEATRKYLLRVARLDVQTILDIKNYFKKLWIIDQKMEQTAIDELTRLVNDPRVKNNIKNYVEHGKFPWDKSE